MSGAVIEARNFICMSQLSGAQKYTLDHSILAAQGKIISSIVRNVMIEHDITN